MNRVNLVKKGEKGFLLIEVLIGLVILVIVGVALFNASSTGWKSVFLMQGRTTAESLARDQIERIKEATYVNGATEYSVVMPGEYSDVGYSASNIAVPNDPDNGIQMIEVTVIRDGKDILVLEDYKVR